MTIKQSLPQLLPSQWPTPEYRRWCMTEHYPVRWHIYEYEGKMTNTVRTEGIPPFLLPSALPTLEAGCQIGGVDLPSGVAAEIILGGYSPLHPAMTKSRMFWGNRLKLSNWEIMVQTCKVDWLDSKVIYMESLINNMKRKKGIVKTSDCVDIIDQL